MLYLGLLIRIPTPMPVRSGAAQVSRRNRNTEKNILVKIILMSKDDVSDAFRNVRVDADEVHQFC